MGGLTMAKVILNKGFGGFGVSAQAHKRYAEKLSKKLFYYAGEYTKENGIVYTKVPLGISISLPWYFSKEASNCPKFADIVQYSSGLKTSISLSRSTINFNATLCTLPAVFAPILFCNNLLSLKPIILSRILLVSWLLTKLSSITVGFLIASITLSWVISWNKTLS